MKNVNHDPKISKMLLLTAQEHELLGSTPKLKPRTDAEWYQPQALLTGEYDHSSVASAREGLKHVANGVVGKLLGLEGKVIVIGLSELDETGKTIHDPEIGTGRVNKLLNIEDVHMGGDDGVLAEKFLNVIREFGGDPHLRNEKPDITREGNGGGPERG